MFRTRSKSQGDLTHPLDVKSEVKKAASEQDIRSLKKEIGKIEQDITQEFQKIKTLYNYQSYIYPDPIYELMKKSKQNFESKLDQKSLEKMNRKYFEREMDLALFEWAQTPKIEKRSRLILERIDQLNHLRKNKISELQAKLKYSIHKIDLELKLIEWNALPEKKRKVNAEKKIIQDSLAIITTILTALYHENEWDEMPTHEKDLISRAKKYRDCDYRLLPELKKIYDCYDKIIVLNSKSMTEEQQVLTAQRKKLLRQLRKLGSGISGGNPEEVVDLYKRHKF